MFKPFARVIIRAAVAAAIPAAFVLSQEKPKEITHSVSVNAVTILVTVQDRSGLYVTNLTERDLTVFENGQPKISSADKTREMGGLYRRVFSFSFS